MTDFTPKQQKALDWLKREILKNDGLQSVSDDYEYKRFEVSRINDKKIQLITEVGRKGDEGTMAEVFCRTRRQIFIGPRGGCKLANAKSKTGKVLFTYITGQRVTYHPTI